MNSDTEAKQINENDESNSGGEALKQLLMSLKLKPREVSTQTHNQPPVKIRVVSKAFLNHCSMFHVAGSEDEENPNSANLLYHSMLHMNNG